MKYYSSSVDLLFNEFKNDNILLESKNSNPIKFKSNITINNLEFKYSKNSRGILKNVNLKIAKGDFIGIIGASGSGKSTLVDLIMGLFYPTGGSISVDGENINQTILGSEYFESLYMDIYLYKPPILGCNVKVIHILPP